MKVFAGIILFLSSCVTISAQTAVNKCPEVNVIGPSALTKAGDLITFTASIDNAPTGKIEYGWSVSAGMIEQGQWTSSIQVRTTTEMGGTNVTATVKIAGLAPGCADIASETSGIAPVLRYEPYDVFEKLKRDDVKARIDNFYIQLANSPDIEGLIIVTLNEKETRNEKTRYLNNIYHGIVFLHRDPARVSFIISEGDYDNVPVTRLYGVFLDKDLKDFSAIGGGNPIVIKGEDFKQKIKTLFPINK